MSKKFDVTLIDCEAGPEQVNRRVVNGVDDLIIVTDASLRGARVAGSIMEVIQRNETVRPSRASLVINRSSGDNGLIAEHAKKWGLEILGRIPDDRNITDYDAVGTPLIELPDNPPSVMAVKEICGRIFN